VARMNYRSLALVTSCALVALVTAGRNPARAQDAGPMRAPTPAAPTFSAPETANKPEPPPMPPEEMIKRFAAKEDEMVHSILGYGFQKSVRLEEIGPDNKPSGQVEIVTQFTAGPDGKLYEKPLRRTKSTLQYLQAERGDSDLVAATPLFPLTTSQLSKYEIIFQGKQPLDELSAYIFAVKPRALDRAHAYFSGVVWVEEQDLVIVKTIGKWVTETGDVTSSVLPFTVFETYRQQVGKNQWFPSYSRSDESILAGDTRVPIRIVIRWTNFAPLASAQSGGTPPNAAPPDNNAKP
jgi:hypothetical protein